MSNEFTNKINEILKEIEQYDEYNVLTCKGKNFNFKDLKDNQLLFEDENEGKLAISVSNPEFYFGFSDRDSEHFTYYFNGKMILESSVNFNGLISININGEEIVNEKKNEETNEEKQQEILYAIRKIVVQIGSNLLMFYDQNKDDSDIPDYYDL